MLLGRRDWVYLLSLLVPFVAYNLALKASSVASIPGLAPTFALMRSDVFFNLGYALLWIGLFAAARKGPLRWVVVFLFHAVTILVVIVTTVAHQYYKENGATLDYGTLAGWVPKFDQIEPILAPEVPHSSWALLFAALFYAALGPLLVTRPVEWRWGWARRSPTGTAGTFFLGSVGLVLLALGFGSLSLLAGPAGANTPLARNPVVNVVLTGVQEATTGEETAEETGRSAPGEDPDAHAGLAQTPRTEKRNVVLIHLESARAQSVTPYNEDLKTMPFLDELAKESLLAERAHVVVPRSSKGSTAANCGVEPAVYPGPEYEPGGIPVPCLADLLQEQGYRTVFFQSLWTTGDNERLAKNFGYEEFYPSQSMNTEGFRVTNTFGYEDDIMLGPSEEWLKENGDEPFLAKYFTGTGHYGYECVPNRYGYEYFSKDEELDRYHNCLRMLDFFLKNLIEQYKKLGLYEDTIFVMYGDHGEGFREHGRYMHGDNIYEEGLWVPLIIHAPGWFEGGERAKGLSSQIDILPTVLEMLGYEIKDGEYPGYSLLHPLPEDRILMSSCISPYRCMASLRGTEKYIYHFGDQAEEFFDLSEDPREERNLAGERAREELDRRREELLGWRSRIDARYGSFAAQP